MSTLRLTFLYPHLFRSLRASEPAAQTARQCSRSSRSRRTAPFTTSARQRVQFVERHGKAVEPYLSPQETKEDVRVFVPETTGSATKRDSAKGGDESRAVENDSSTKSKDAMENEIPSSSAPLSAETQAAARIPGDPDPDGNSDLENPAAATAPKQEPNNPTPTPDGPLEIMLQTKPPVEGSPDNLHIPHLHPPPYVHNFDTYTLVKDVETGGFTPEQAITAMKAVRTLLAKNLEVAKEGLVSKSDVENETYLFRAACSELRTEIQNTRKASDEQMRRERTQLQHEVDILNQKLTQELLTLRDELTGMFNDRKMAVKMDQRGMDSSIQQLNYKITVSLNSDSKSEVEGLRWVLTRRSVLAIVFMALMVLSSLRYASYRAHEEELEVKRREKLAEADRKKRLRREKEGGGEGMMALEGGLDGSAKGKGAGDGDGDEDLEMASDLPAGVAAETLAAN